MQLTSECHLRKTVKVTFKDKKLYDMARDSFGYITVLNSFYFIAETPGCHIYPEPCHRRDRQRASVSRES